MVTIKGVKLNKELLSPMIVVEQVLHLPYCNIPTRECMLAGVDDEDEGVSMW